VAAQAPDQPVTIRRRLKALRRDLAYFGLLGPVLKLLEHAPRPVIRGLVALFEPLAYRATRKTSIRHLELVYGDALDAAGRARIARGVTRNFVAGLEEFLTALRDGPESLDDRIDDAAARALLARLHAESPRGFVGLTGHIGNWELLGSWIARHGSRGLGAAVARRHPNARLNAHIESLRRRLGLETFYRDEPPTRPIRFLREGRYVAVVPDQDVKSLAGMFVDFLGRRAYTPLGPARLALAADVPIVCGFLLRNADGSLRIEVAEPIRPDRRAPRAEEVERLTRAWSAAVESAVRAAPEQWVWFHERWRTTPELLAARGRSALNLDR
jgi:KDO2-lipid IV(A) lauroyltransferase